MAKERKPLTPVTRANEERALDFVSDGIASGRRIRLLAPERIRCDNGPELTSRHLLAWAIERRIELLDIQPGRPMAERACGELERKNARGVSEHELVSQTV